MDVKFPIIFQDLSLTPLQRGQEHGESYREAIRELSDIREGLMLQRSPHLKDRLEQLALEQWEKTREFDQDLFEELEGIQTGSNTSITQIVILNNYTDFRDIPADEGCSTVCVNEENNLLLGQTWDMHSTAKNYVTVLQLGQEQLLFSLVGCLGMMGFDSKGAMVGVNNLNSSDARSGILWPALVRKTLAQKNFEAMEETLKTAQVTSAHSYLIGYGDRSALWEILPTVQARTGDTLESSRFFHTNHCLSEEAKELETTIGKASTTHNRYELLEQKIDNVKVLKDLEDMLCDHENYPKSICSHYESGAQDPSFTCGGAVGSFEEGQFTFWRGCREKDQNYVRHSFELNQGQFEYMQLKV